MSSSSSDTSVSSCASVQSMRDELEEQSYFHGLLPRDDCAELLIDCGDYLVRLSTEEDTPCRVLSARSKQKSLCHLRILPTGDDRLRVEEGEKEFDTVAQLIGHYQSTGEVVFASSKIECTVVLLVAVARPPWHLQRSSLRLLNKLGAGQFGDVFKASLGVGRGSVVVAVKSMKEEGLSDKEGAREEFMKEGSIMRKYEHENIVRLLGVIIDSFPVFLVMELCVGGSLLGRLEEEPTLEQLSVLQRNTWLMQIAQGMRYLEKHNVLHRDLAARNCLLSVGDVAKVGDLGMATVHNGDGVIAFDAQAKVPMRWLAPECWTTRASSLTSDVWAFGILVWEVYNQGLVPFSSLSPRELKAGHESEEGCSLLPGPIMTRKMAVVMKECMQSSPTARPSFLQLKLKMRRRCNANKIRHLSSSWMARLTRSKSNITQ